MYPRETLRILDSLDIPKADREMIDYKNLEAVTGVKLGEVAAFVRDR